LGKDAIQIAQELLVKKLGELSGEDTTQDTPDIDFYMQHFDQPIKSAKMEAIKMLIEQEAKKQKTSAIQKKAAVAPAMEA